MSCKDSPWRQRIQRGALVSTALSLTSWAELVSTALSLTSWAELVCTALSLTSWAELVSTAFSLASLPFICFRFVSIHHNHYQSLNREGRWGTTDDFATSFLHFPCFPLPSGACRTPGLSIPWCCLPTLFPLSTLSSSPFHCALQDGFG